MLPRGSPTLQSGGQNHGCPISGPGAYITLAIWGVPNVSEWGTNSEMALKCAGWLHKPYRLGGPQRLRAGDKFRSWPTSGPGDYITLTVWGSPTPQSGGHIQNWPTSGPGGYTTHAA